LPPNRNRPADNSGTVSKKAGGLVPTTVPPRSDRRPFHKRLEYARRVASELDHLFGLWKYPNPSELYAAAPSREAALDE